jgi:hypothetical protein
LVKPDEPVPARPVLGLGSLQPSERAREAGPPRPLVRDFSHEPQAATPLPLLPAPQKVPRLPYGSESNAAQEVRVAISRHCVGTTAIGQ